VDKISKESLSGFDFAQYQQALRFLGYISHLFSSSSTPLIVPKAAERLFSLVTKSEDLGTQDKSFDALMPNGLAVGIKTFRMPQSSTAKTEKVAELTAQASQGNLSNLTNEQMAIRVSELRNSRVVSDAVELGASADEAIYHCLIRKPGFAVVHEELYPTIDVEKIYPLDRGGKKIASFSLQTHGNVWFSDGNSHYNFSRAKNVLNRKFELAKGFTSPPIELRAIENIWDLVLGGELATLFEGFLEVVKEPEVEDAIVLPLYGSRSTEDKKVEEKSGINQWNAGGRARTYAEAYIPYPVAAKKDKPNFFPPRDQKFLIRLPSGKVISAKVCQQGSKAIMSDPNHDLVDWLLPVIDGSREKSLARFASRIPYTYKDLLQIGKDSVRIHKETGKDWDYRLEMAPIGSFEQFLEDSDPLED
jgi:hypothetical protein